MAESRALHRYRGTPPTPQPGMSVLVVDDDELIRMHLQLALSNEGFEIIEAQSGPDALSLAMTQDFDIVLMDGRMPGMDGFATCEQFKRLPGKALTPVVMLTGLDDLESIKRASEVGATDYLTKPLSVSVLAKRLRHIVHAQRNCIELENERASQTALLHAIPDAILRFDAEGILLASKFPEPAPATLRMRAAIGSSIDTIFAGIAQFEPTQALKRALRGDTTPLQISWCDTSETTYEVRLVASGTNDVICILRDATKQVRQQRHIEKLSLTDSLTGLPNRACFLQVAQRHLDTAPEQPLCMLQLSFASYPSVKNSVGRKIADKVISVVAEKLLSSTGASQQRGDYSANCLPFIARTGDSEFHVLLRSDPDQSELRLLMQRVSDAFEPPIQVDQYEFCMPLRSGAACTQAGNISVDELLKMSGLAAQKASQQLSADTVFYTPQFQLETQRTLNLETQLRKAIAQGELDLVYQPKVCATTGQLRSVEVLSRWNHAELGSISPAEFIPLAEETGLILPLGEFVLERACLQSRQWQLEGYANIPIAVNVSGHQFNQRQVDQQLFRLLERMQVPSQAIELEITESVLVEQQHVRAVLERIRERGIRIAVDDFGTGHSSLSMLKEFPIDILKIDRAFVKDITDTQRSYGIVDTIIALGHSLQLTLVAEGIETEAQLSYLRERNCHLIQGYLTGRPMTPGDIEEQFLRVLKR